MTTEAKLLERQLMTAQWSRGEEILWPIHKRYIMSRQELSWQRKHWIAKNRTAVSEIARRCYLKNRDKIMARQKEWREKNRERQRLYFKEHYLIHRTEKLRKASVRWFKKKFAKL